MAKTKSNTRRKSRKRRQTTKHSDRLIGSLAGIIIILLVLTGMFQLGAIGSMVLAIFKFVVGNSYYLLMVITILYALGLTIYNRLVHFRTRWVWGMVAFYAGLLLYLHTSMFNELNQHSHFLIVTWNNLIQNTVNADSTIPIGGGMLGALLYSGSSFLLGPTGSAILSWLLMITGVVVFFALPWHQWLIKLEILFSKLWQDLRKHSVQQVKKVHNQKTTSPVTKEPSPVKSSQPIIPNRQPKITVAEQPDIQSTTGATQDGSVPSSKSNENQEPDVDLSTNSETDDSDYQLPPLSLLTKVKAADQSADLHSIKANTKKLQSTLRSFGVEATVENVNLGPSVTKYELRPAVGVKVSKITHLADDLALALAAKDIRIEAPIPGKSLIGIEVPNQQVATVGFRNMIEATPQHLNRPLEVPLGRTVTGDVMTADLTKMPHLLIAGATGSGKSVAINVILTSILMKAKPHQVKFLMIDPKKVELSVYNGIPHLLSPVVSDPKKAARALAKVVAEMERRYELFASFGIRNINGYNAKLKESDDHDPNQPYLPLILVVVDELADLMMTVSKEVEDSIVRIAQMGRAAGIHMILATQRPSVDVITGLIKANVPSRIAFAVSSGVDSRTIIDTNGAEKLLGRGDMLFEPIDQNKPTRVQGAFISDHDVESVVKFIKDEQPAEYDKKMVVSDEEIKQEEASEEQDPMFNEALDFVIDQQKASTSLLQRRFRIGYNRAARIIDDMEQRGYIGPANGSKPRDVYKQKKPK